MKNTIRLLLISAAIVLVLALGALGVAWNFVNQPASESPEQVVFEVPPGESFKATARRLEEQGLVSSSSKFQLLARVLKQTNKIRVGEYALRRDATPKDVLSTLTSGRSIEYAVTIREGYNKYEIAEQIERQKIGTKAEFLALTTDRALIKELLGEELPSLEGYLFPETYHITKFTGTRGLVKMMVQRFNENIKRVAPTAIWHPSEQRQFTRHQLVTLASIVEKETGAPEERPVISSVFHNRLRINMRLQTDPTVIYGVWDRSGAWNRNISRDDLLTPTRYNTYTLNGLPYGPIANPGLEALKAAAAPAQTDYLFFVSRNDGTHIFSRDYTGHQRAVTQFQLDRKAREGKSWRDLQKREAVPEKVIEAAPSRSSAAKPASASNKSR